MVKRRLFFLLFLFLGLWPQLADAARVQAIADRNQLALGESLLLQLRVQGSSDGDPDLTPLDQDWEVLGRSQSSQIQIVNGDFSRSLVYALTLLARREGDLTIPAICFGSDCSAPLPIRVSAAGQTPAGADSAELLLETEATPSRLFTQQQLLFKVRLLHRVDLGQGSLSEPQPSGVDAVVQKLGDDRSFETRRGGRLYRVIERAYAIYPQASGSLEIPPLRFDGEISRDAARFDPFGRHGERVRKQTQALSVEVLSPPADRDGRPWLPAQTLSLEDDWQGKVPQLTVGEPATRTLTLTAAGLQAAQLPELHFGVPADFKNYPDQPARKDHTGASGITGVLQQKIALVPTRPGRYLLPQISLDWWDVSTQQWRQAQLDPVTIEVGPAPGATVVAPPAAQQPPPLADPAPSAPAPAAPAAGLPPAAKAGQPGFWPWFSLALGLGWLATLLLLARQKTKRSRLVKDSGQDTPQQRQKAARQTVLQAARRNDARATRQALADWSRTLWPDSGADGLERLGRFTPELRIEINRLNRVLYARNSESWSGKELSEAIQQWDVQRRQPNAGNKLPDLYPAPTRNGRET